MDIDQIPSSQSTQKIIQAMQTCEKYNSTAEMQVHTNLISGYPRNLQDVKEYMSKVLFQYYNFTN